MPSWVNSGALASYCLVRPMLDDRLSKLETSELDRSLLHLLPTTGHFKHSKIVSSWDWKDLNSKRVGRAHTNEWMHSPAIMYTERRPPELRQRTPRNDITGQWIRKPAAPIAFESVVEPTTLADSGVNDVSADAEAHPTEQDCRMVRRDSDEKENELDGKRLDARVQGVGSRPWGITSTKGMRANARWRSCTGTTRVTEG